MARARLNVTLAQTAPRWPRPALAAPAAAATAVFLASALSAPSPKGPKHLAWLSMWSAVRDTQCPGGAQSFAQPTCSSVAQVPDAFAEALGAF